MSIFVCLSVCLASLREFDHVEIVKGHMVSVSSKDHHETLGVNICSVTVSGSWLLSSDHTKLGGLCTYMWAQRLVKHSCLVSMLLSLLHGMIVLIKAFISILDYK